VEVLAVVARGLTATACGHLLRISERTVRKHLENAYAKLDCHTAIVAISRARALGLLRVAVSEARQDLASSEVADGAVTGIDRANADRGMA
jgi:DNA-binding CsgD family transcriptional regulator